jgi:hypothetical protein
MACTGNELTCTLILSTTKKYQNIAISKLDMVIHHKIFGDGVECK